MYKRRRKSYWFIILTSIFLIGVIAYFAYISPMQESIYDRSNRLFSGEKYFFYNSQLILRDPEIKDNIYKQECFHMRDGRMYYEEEGVETWFGIDVSGYQEWIRWSRVAQDGVQFAFIRIGNRGYGEGYIYKDSKFEYNYSEARKNGIPVGLYFFSQAINDEEAIEEADYVLNQLGGRPLDLPIVFDWENFGDYQEYEISFQQLNHLYDVFEQEVSNRGFESMLYGSKFYLNNVWTHTDTRPVWLAQYNDWPNYTKPYKIWQCTDSGVLDGIPEKVDLDILFTE